MGSAPGTQRAEASDGGGAPPGVRRQHRTSGWLEAHRCRDTGPCKRGFGYLAPSRDSKFLGQQDSLVLAVLISSTHEALTICHLLF